MPSDKRKILWVDDEIDLLKSHILYLSSRNYEVTSATNGPDALELIRNQRFDLVLLDEQMPVMEGLEVLKQIKEIRSELPVIMVTKNEAEELMDQAIGSQIDGFLTKPVNPSQVLSVLKRTLDSKAISASQFSQNWAREFARLSQIIDGELDANGWFDLQNKLCVWEQRIDGLGDSDLSEMIADVRLEADRQFAKWIDNEYKAWLKLDSGDRPPISVDLVDKWLIPLLKEQKPVLFLVVDCLRLDQWMAIESLLSTRYNVKRENYFSILPTATPYSRNALFSGLMPSELERLHPDLWTDNDEDEASSNRFEHQFLNNLLHRRGYDLKPESKYIKVLEVEELSEFERKVQDYINLPLTSVVYNFVDILIHTRQKVEVLKEMLPDESAFRSVTKAWFQHSALYRIIQAYLDSGGYVLITSDHGSVRGKRGSKVIGDKQTSTSLRYKHGRNLRADPKQSIKIKKPEEWGLPRRGGNTEYILAREDYFFVYPTNYHKYLDLYRNSFQHGGISLDEMVLPVVTLKGKG